MPGGYASRAAGMGSGAGLEQHRVAEAARPEMMAAARRIARLVEQLSEEVIRARELTAGLTELGVLTTDLGHEFGSLVRLSLAAVTVESANAGERAAVMPALYDDTGPPLLLCGYAASSTSPIAMATHLERVAPGAFQFPGSVRLDFDHQGRCLASTYGGSLQALEG